MNTWTYEQKKKRRFVKVVATLSAPAIVLSFARKRKGEKSRKMVGEEIEVMLLSNTDSDVHVGWKGHWIPLLVKEEYKYFYLCEVLPHVNPINKGGKKLSEPYNITIQKWDIGRKWKIRKGKS